MSQYAGSASLKSAHTEVYDNDTAYALDHSRHFGLFYYKYF